MTPGRISMQGASAMRLDDNCLLCNPQFHSRFCKTTEVLALILAAAPYSVGPPELLDKTRLPPKQLLNICQALCRAGLVRQHEVFAANWVLCMSAAHLTLEDVFYCVAREFDDGIQPTAAPSGSAASELGGVNAFLMQASIATNQCFLKELRRFSLARLRTVRPAWTVDRAPDYHLAKHAARVVADADAGLQ